MVRLKDPRYCTHFSTAYISIPYGAIKRNRMSNRDEASGEFQFLMVRLKEPPYYQNGISILKFQFLMVRLKVQGILQVPYTK